MEEGHLSRGRLTLNCSAGVLAEALVVAVSLQPLARTAIGRHQTSYLECGAYLGLAYC